jgi:indole-3-glycerol phosphate synthase
MEFIAEVKTISPFGWKSSESWEELFSLANTHGNMLSIHTDVRWGGSFELLKRAREMTKKPILAKGIHAADEDVRRAVEECGADWVLVVGRIPAVYPNQCIIEPYTLEELTRIPNDMRVLWNSRDISTGELKKETFAEARRLRSGWLCQASNIKTQDDVDPTADAILVGTFLRSFIKSRYSSGILKQ